MSPRPHRITSPTDLLALVPSTLGFHPEDSLVLIVTAGEGGALHARVDLPDDAAETAAALQSLLGAVVRAEARQVVLIAYSEDDLRAEDAVDALALELEVRDIEVVCAIRADGDRWYPLDNVLPFSDEGVAYDVASHPITAQSVLDGRVTYDSRQGLADSLVGTDIEGVEAVQEAADDALRRWAGGSRHPLGMPSPEVVRAHLAAEGYWIRDRVRRFARTGEPLDDGEVGRLLAAMTHVEARDVAWAEMTRDSAVRHVELWRSVVRRSPVDLLAAPAALLAFAAWLAGDGALAWCAVERCHEADPEYSMAGLVAQALVSAIHPSTWRPIAPEELPLFAG